MSKIWKGIGERKKTERISEKIDKKQWRIYFRGQFIRRDERER